MSDEPPVLEPGQHRTNTPALDPGRLMEVGLRDGGLSAFPREEVGVVTAGGVGRRYSDGARRAIREKLHDLQVMERLVEGSQLTEEDVDELAAEIDQRATERATSNLEERD